MLVTAQDLIEFQERYNGGRLNKITEDRALRIFDRLISEIEPRLVITEEGGAIEWIQQVTYARDALSDGQKGSAQRFLIRVADLAKKYWKKKKKKGPVCSLRAPLNNG